MSVFEESFFDKIVAVHWPSNSFALKIEAVASWGYGHASNDAHTAVANLTKLNQQTQPLITKLDTKGATTDYAIGWWYVWLPTQLEPTIVAFHFEPSTLITWETVEYIQTIGAPDLETAVHPGTGYYVGLATPFPGLASPYVPYDTVNFTKPSLNADLYGGDFSAFTPYQLLTEKTAGEFAAALNATPAFVWVSDGSGTVSAWYPDYHADRLVYHSYTYRRQWMFLVKSPKGYPAFSLDLQTSPSDLTWGVTGTAYPLVKGVPDYSTTLASQYITPAAGDTVNCRVYDYKKRPAFTFTN